MESVGFVKLWLGCSVNLHLFEIYCYLAFNVSPQQPVWSLVILLLLSVDRSISILLQCDTDHDQSHVGPHPALLSLLLRIAC